MVWGGFLVELVRMCIHLLTLVAVCTVRACSCGRSPDLPVVTIADGSHCADTVVPNSKSGIPLPFSKSGIPLPFSKWRQKIVILSVVCTQALSGAGCKTRLESRIKKFKRCFMYFMGFCRHGNHAGRACKGRRAAEGLGRCGATGERHAPVMSQCGVEAYSAVVCSDCNTEHKTNDEKCE